MRVERDIWEYRGTHESTKGYTGEQGDAWEYKEIHKKLGDTCKFKGLHKRSKGAWVNRGNR